MTECRITSKVAVMEISEYMTKESIAQQGGYGLATKGPQHDEAWLIFMDQVHHLLPTFQDMPTEEKKMKALRQYREAQYEKLMDAVSERRGWDRDSIPIVAKLRDLGMDLPEILEVIEEAKQVS